ncbi:uncharacterized protein LOC127281146 [Leptopilina boulardi]|uniref:uncharacterized protein LOC127281146 n=1 Tax=Leptopilina boulardi TaxID=63433 RepID=UPI0021F64722|nr:uncharacterized protein LOC127281146 [Leptopilina boulardi]
MRFLSCLLIFLSFYQVQTGVVRRDINDTSANRPPGTGGPQTTALQKTLQGLIEICEKIPVIGGGLKIILQKVVFVIIQIELITNGSVARLLGGALPCVISLSNGIRCSGISQNGGITQLIINDIDWLPNLLVPVLGKEILKFIIKGVLNPIIDVTFGGQREFKPS